MCGINPKLVMNEFKLYPELVKEKQEKIIELKKTQLKKESLQNASSPSYSLVPSSGNGGVAKDSLLIKLIDDEIELEETIKGLQNRIDGIYRILDRLDKETRKLVKDKYIRQLSWSEMEDKYLYSRSGLDAHIRRRLEKLD